MEQFLSLYASSFAFALLVATLGLALLVFLSGVCFPRHSQRHSPVALSRYGGVALTLSFLLVLWYEPFLVLSNAFWILSAALLLTLLFGLLDDARALSWKTQLVFQISLVSGLYLFGIRILTLTNPGGGVFVIDQAGISLLGYALFLAWFLLVINAMNWLDGVDGLCASVSLVTYGALFLLCLYPFVNQPPLAVVSAILIGVTLAFLLFNAPPAKIIAGTSGSLFFGVMIGFLATVAGTKIATALLVLALPICDALFVLWKRYRAGSPLTQPDGRHLHYQLRVLGFSDRGIVGIFVLITLGIAAVALSTIAWSKFLALLIIIPSLFIFLFLVDRAVAQRSL